MSDKNYTNYIEKIKNILPIILYYVIGNFVFRNLLIDSAIWNHADASFPMDQNSLDYLFQSIKGVWWNRNFLGYNTTFQTILSASYILTWSLFHFLFKDFSVIQFFWYVLIFFVSCTSMYYLTHYFFENTLIAFLSGLLYGLNPWIVDRMIVVPIYQAYAFIPTLFLFYVIFIVKREIKYAIFFSFVAFFIISSLHYTYYSFLLIFLYAIYYYLTNRHEIRLHYYLFDNMKLFIITFTLLGFYSLPALCSFLIDRGENVIEALKRFSETNITAFIYGKELTVFNVLRLLGFHDSFYKESSCWLTIPFSLLPILLATLFLLTKYKKNRIQCFFYILILIGVFLSSSTILLDRFTYKTFLLNIPLFNILAKLPDPHYHVFLVTFSYGPLVGLSMYLITEKFCKLNTFSVLGVNIYRLFAISLFFLLIAAIAHPLLKWSDRRYKQFIYPPEYNSVASFLSTNTTTFRILVWPPHHSVRHKWAPYFVSNLDKFIFNVDSFGSVILEATPQHSYEFSTALSKSIVNKNALLNLLRIGNVKYAVVTNDVIDDPPYIWADKKKVTIFLDTMNHLKGVFSVQKYKNIHLYEMDKDQLLPHIYAGKYKKTAY